MKPNGLRPTSFLGWLSVAICLLCGLLLAARAVQQSGWFFLNRGFVALNHGLAQEDALEAANHLRAARSQFERSLTWQSAAFAGWRGLGFVAYASDATDETLFAWQQVSDMPAELLAWGHLARINGDEEAALAWYELARELNGELADASYYVGLTHLLSGSTFAARQAFEEGIERRQYRDVGGSDLLFRLGQSYASPPGEDFVRALGYFDRALAVDAFEEPATRVRTLFARGDALRQQGLFDEASDAFLSVLQADPGHYWARIRLATLFWRAGETRRAEKLLGEAIALNPSEKWAYRTLGMLYESVGQFAEAAELYRQVLMIDPTDETVMERLSEMADAEVK